MKEIAMTEHPVVSPKAMGNDWSKGIICVKTPINGVTRFAMLSQRADQRFYLIGIDQPMAYWELPHPKSGTGPHAISEIISNAITHILKRPGTSVYQFDSLRDLIGWLSTQIGEMHTIKTYSGPGDLL